MGHRVSAYVLTPLGDTGSYETHLPLAKSLINRKRNVTVPRLELVAALPFAQTAEMLFKEVGVGIKRYSVTLIWKQCCGGLRSLP